jgi:hypothetical protein
MLLDTGNFTTSDKYARRSSFSTRRWDELAQGAASELSRGRQPEHMV